MLKIVGRMIHLVETIDNSIGFRDEPIVTLALLRLEDTLPVISREKPGKGGNGKSSRPLSPLPSSAMLPRSIKKKRTPKPWL